MSEQIAIASDLYDDLEAIPKEDYKYSQGSRSPYAINSYTTVKSNYTKDDYDYLRGYKPRSRKGVIDLCQEAYENVGIVQNVINLMADFGSKGITIRHPDPKINLFCQKFANKVKVAERSERFLNYLYRLGAAAIYKKMGRAVNSITSKYIPIEYIFLNPGSLRVKGEETGFIPSKFEYYIQYSSDVMRSLRIEEKPSSIPEELKKYKNQLNTIPYNRLKVYNYRKDDWSFWGLPIIHCILDDLRLLEKLKLSDISALDGAVSNVRLWNVGQITNDARTTIIPTKETLRRVHNIIAQGISGGSMDVVFGPEVTFKDSSTSVHQFLGEEKYKPTIDSIYDGLGIPSPLRSSNTSSNSNSAISLKTLIERLNYGRNYLVDFWKNELLEIFETLGFNTNDDPVIEFDTMILTDEAAEKKLLLDMVDRDIIDLDTVHERFNMNSKIIKNNLSKDMKERGNKIPPKAGPFHNAHIEDNIKQSLLSDGLVTPDEIGVDINVSREEFTQRKQDKESSQFSNTPGRPPNITETEKRKKKSQAMIWATKAQKEISDIITPIFLKMHNKKNVRSLTNDQTNLLEETKAKVLLTLDPFTKIEKENIINSVGIKVDLNELKNEWEDMEKTLGEITIDQKRQITSEYYSDFLFNNA